MIANTEPVRLVTHESYQRIGYIKEMLGQLTQAARAEQAELLVYLLEMAYTEASDIHSGKRGLNANLNGDQAARMSVKASREI